MLYTCQHLAQQLTQASELVWVLMLAHPVQNMSMVAQHLPEHIDTSRVPCKDQLP